MDICSILKVLGVRWKSDCCCEFGLMRLGGGGWRCSRERMLGWVGMRDLIRISWRRLVC